MAKQIADHYGDACVVAMEDFGAIFAANQESKPAIVIRGISDMTENKEPGKDRILQPIAAAHAAAFAFELLAQWGNFYPSAPGISSPETDAVITTDPAALEIATTKIKATRATFVLNLDADLDQISTERVEQIEIALRELAGEPGLTIERVEKGSVRLIVSDPSGALSRRTNATTYLQFS